MVVDNGEVCFAKRRTNHQNGNRNKNRTEDAASNDFVDLHICSYMTHLRAFVFVCERLFSAPSDFRYIIKFCYYFYFFFFVRRANQEMMIFRSGFFFFITQTYKPLNHVYDGSVTMR